MWAETIPKTARKPGILYIVLFHDAARFIYSPYSYNFSYLYYYDYDDNEKCWFHNKEHHRFIDFSELCKIPKCEIFDLLDYRYIYTTKSLWVSDLGAEIKNSYILQLGFHFTAESSVYF